MSLLGKLGRAAGAVVGAAANAVEGAAKQVIAPGKSVVDGFEHAATSALHTIERNGVVIGSALFREVGRLTGPDVLGEPHTEAGVGKPPVILLSGQGGTASLEMAAYARSLERDGFKVYCFDDPQHGMASAADTAKRLDALVDSVRAQTGAAKVSLVGYSTGGTNARAYANLYGGADKVDRVVQVAGSNNGDPGAFGFCDSGLEEKPGTPFMQALNAHQADVPVWSIYEQGTDGEVLESDAKLKEDALRHNLPLPQLHPNGSRLGFADHIQLPTDARAYAKVLTALCD
jgi:pimeloyl-ACP methyl ester carboxylesterase